MSTEKNTKTLFCTEVSFQKEVLSLVPRQCWLHLLLILTRFQNCQVAGSCSNFSSPAKRIQTSFFPLFNFFDAFHLVNLELSGWRCGLKAINLAQRSALWSHFLSTQMKSRVYKCYIQMYYSYKKLPEFSLTKVPYAPLAPSVMLVGFIELKLSLNLSCP